DRPVIDRTNLKGPFDFRLHYTVDPRAYFNPADLGATKRLLQGLILPAHRSSRLYRKSDWNWKRQRAQSKCSLSTASGNPPRIKRERHLSELRYRDLSGCLCPACPRFLAADE